MSGFINQLALRSIEVVENVMGDLRADSTDSKGSGRHSFIIWGFGLADYADEWASLDSF